MLQRHPRTGGCRFKPPGLKKVQDFGQNSIKPPPAFPSFLRSDRHAVLYSCFWCQIMSIGAEKLEETLLSSQAMFCFHSRLAPWQYSVPSYVIVTTLSTPLNESCKMN